MLSGYPVTCFSPPPNRESIRKYDGKNRREEARRNIDLLKENELDKKGAREQETIRQIFALHETLVIESARTIREREGGGGRG